MSAEDRRSDFFGPGAEKRVAEFLKRDGRLELTFTMSGEPHAVRVRPAERAVG